MSNLFASQALKHSWPKAILFGHMSPGQGFESAARMLEAMGFEPASAPTSSKALQWISECKCRNCGKALIDPLSQARGLGPDCFSALSR